MTISKNDNFRQKIYTLMCFYQIRPFFHHAIFLMNLNPITPKDHGNTIRV